jgi:hypothetical protein
LRIFFRGFFKKKALDFIYIFNFLTYFELVLYVAAVLMADNQEYQHHYRHRRTLLLKIHPKTNDSGFISIDYAPV